MSFREVDENVNRCIDACRAAIAAAAEAERLAHEVFDTARRIAYFAEVASIHAGAGAELQKQAVEYRGWERTFTRKSRLFDKG